MKPSKLLYIDQLLLWPNKCLDLLYLGVRKLTSKKRPTGYQVLVLKLAGMGSLIKLASVFHNNNVDFSKITLCTFEQNKEITRILGFTNVIYLPENFFGLVKTCILLPFQNTYSYVYDAERNVNATSIFRKYLSIFGRSKSVTYTTKEDNSYTNDYQFSLSGRSHFELFKVVLPFFQKRANSSKNYNFTRAVPLKQILININASDYLSARRFPKEKFEQLIQTISSLYSEYQIVLTGAKSEMKYVGSLESSLMNKNIKVNNKTGKWNLERLKQELLRTSIFITNDSGPMHLAIWLKTPTICIWGPTQSIYSGYPEGEIIKNISLNMACSPCFYNAQSKWGKDCKKAITCMTGLSTDEIMMTVNNLMGKR